MFDQLSTSKDIALTSLFLHEFLIVLISEQQECLPLTNDAATCWSFISHRPRTWTEALEDCISRGGHLAVESAAQPQVDSLLAAAVQNSPNATWWVGLRNALSDRWTWNSQDVVSKLCLFCVFLISALLPFSQTK